MKLDDMNQATGNRHGDALAVQAGACNLGGVARGLVRAINQCRDENLGTQAIRDDPAIRLFVHQMAHLCRIGEVDSSLDVYEQLTRACEEKDAAGKAEALQPA